MDRTILTKATSDDPEDPSGWLLSLVGKMVQKNYSTSEQVVSFICNRSKSPNPHIARKGLKVLKYLAENGPPWAIEQMTQKMDIIRECANFRGQKDPLHGDSLNVQVRSAAQQAIESIYRSAEQSQANKHVHQSIDESFDHSKNQGGYFSRFYSSSSSPQHVSSHNMFQGMSSDSDTYHNDVDDRMNPPPGMTNSGYGSEFQGFGNPDFTQNIGSMKSQDEKSGGWKILAPFSKLYSGKKSSSSFNHEEYPNFITEQQRRESYQPPTAPNSFFDKPTPSSAAVNSSPRRGQIEWESSTNNSPTKKKSNSRNPLTSTPSVDSNQSYEESIVEGLCSSTGVRVQPSRQELLKFVQQAATLNGKEIASSLDKKLSDTNKWQTRLKALSAIEALIKSENDKVKSYFKSNFDHIGKQTEAVQSSVSKKANSILSLLDPSFVVDQKDEEVSSTRTKPTNESSDSALVSLIDDSSNEESQTKNVTSLFEKMQVKPRNESPQRNDTSSPGNLDDLLINEDEKKSRERSNSKKSILDTLDQLMGDEDAPTQHHVMQPTTQSRRLSSGNHSPITTTTSTTTIPTVGPHHSPYMGHVSNMGFRGRGAPFKPRFTPQELAAMQTSQQQKREGFSFIENGPKQSDDFDFVKQHMMSLKKKDGQESNNGKSSSSSFGFLNE